MSDIDRFPPSRTDRLKDGIVAKIRGDDVYTPPVEPAPITRAVPGEASQLVHLDLPFWDVFVLVLKILVSLFLVSLPVAIAAYLIWSYYG